MLYVFDLYRLVWREFLVYASENRLREDSSALLLPCCVDVFQIGNTLKKKNPVRIRTMNTHQARSQIKIEEMHLGSLVKEIMLDLSRTRLVFCK